MPRGCACCAGQSHAAIATNNRLTSMAAATRSAIRRYRQRRAPPRVHLPASSGEPSENAIRGARLVLIRCMQQPRLVQQIRKNGSVTVVLRDPGSTELGKQIIQLNGGPLTARGPQLDLLSRRWAAVNGWPAATARALAPGPPTGHQRCEVGTNSRASAEFRMAGSSHRATRPDRTRPRPPTQPTRSQSRRQFSHPP